MVLLVAVDACRVQLTLKGSVDKEREGVAVVVHSVQLDQSTLQLVDKCKLIDSGYRSNIQYYWQ